MGCGGPGGGHAGVAVVFVADDAVEEADLAVGLFDLVLNLGVGSTFLVGGADGIFVAHSANCGNDARQNRKPLETAA